MLLEDVSATGPDEASTLLRQLICEAQTICDVVVRPPAALGSAAESDAGDGDLITLREEMSPLLARLQSNLNALQLLNRFSGMEDVRRIASAVNELSEFVEHGKLSSTSVEPLPPAIGEQFVPNVRGLLLVVDDNEANRDLLKRHLERQGYVVDQASGGSEAIGMLRAKPYDAMLLDLLMPKMNGIEVLTRVKSDPELANVPVLVVSASDRLATVADSLQRGAEDYLLKPFEPVLMRARLSATLERKRLRDQERRKSEELEHVSRALSRSNDDLQRFAYAASHDLQTPLRTVISYMQLLERRLADRLTDDDRELLIFAQNAGKRMSSLIQDLLAFSQVSTQERAEELVNCNVIVQSIVHDFKSLIEEARATVTHDSLPVVLADWARMRQLFQNLISNAIKYRRDQPVVVEILAVKEVNFWKFGVRDNGQGIELRYQEKVFEMFQRLHGEETPGSGIGLAICKRIVERLGGRIWFDSAPGSGSTFWFTIPVEP